MSTWLPTRGEQPARSSREVGNKSNLVILVSGHGSNLQAILEACTDGHLRAQVTAVIANKRGAYGLERARLAEVPAIYYPQPIDQERRAYDAALADLVNSYHPTWVVLAGWMRVLSSSFLDRFPNHVVNLHPALPGTFPGVNAIHRALEAYQHGEIQHTGVMVHLVPDEGVDAGPV